MNISLFFESINASGVFGSILFGFLIGAFYGFDLNQEAPVVYPYRFWLVGLGFVVLLAINNYLTQVSPLEFAAARAVLWTFLCGAIPIGRWCRLWFEKVRLDRRLERFRSRGGEG